MIRCATKYEQPGGIQRSRFAGLSRRHRPGEIRSLYFPNQRLRRDKTRTKSRNAPRSYCRIERQIVIERDMVRARRIDVGLALKESIGMPPAIRKPVWLDVEIPEDDATLAALMALGVTGCSRCHRDTMIAAYVTFAGSDISMALCGPCYQA